ncbi:MAG TPA: sensor domain-containing diguanylate cyclase, partial [Planctomycetota bacterium]|nr:sensor domain-containing diguanylate cyclase [Planctomycetota bacterium]
SARDLDTLAAGYALAVGALAQVRLAEVEPAQGLLDKALDALHRHRPHEIVAFTHLVSAELSLVQDDPLEARVFAQDAFETGQAKGLPWIRARALLVKAICEERTGKREEAIRLLGAAGRELGQQDDAETRWLVESALAHALENDGRSDEAEPHRKAAVAEINRIAEGLSAEARDRYLKNPAILQAMGAETLSRSGLWKVPVQIAPDRKGTASESGLDRLRPVLDVIKKINSELNLRNLITMILDVMIEYCNARRGTIVVFEGDRFKVELSRDRAKNDLRRVEIGVSKTVLRLVRETGRRVIAEDARQDPSLGMHDSVQDQSLLSILCTPLRVKTRLIGAVYLDNPEQVGAFGPREIEVAEILTDHAAVAIDNALLHIKSIHDGLTGLFNHSHFEKRLDHEVARARRHGRPCGLLMMDVDDFKRVNDTYGHDAGNEILKNVSRILNSTLRTADLVARRQERDRDASPIVARYGGDEFEIILPETNREGILRAGERILEAVRTADFKYGDRSISLSFSVGGAVCPDDASDARELLLRADEALYAAKRAGKNQVKMSGQ